MKVFLRTLLLLTLITPAGLVMAHSDHAAINEQTVIQVASKAVQQMTFKDMGYEVGKLDSSWKAVQVSDIEVVDMKDGFYLLRLIHSETKKSLSLKIAFSGQELAVTFLPDKD